MSLLEKNPSLEIFSSLFNALNDMELVSWQALLTQQLTDILITRPHGDFSRWHQSVKALPNIEPEDVKINALRAYRRTTKTSEQFT